MSKLVKKSGSWFSYGETKLGQGKEVFKVMEDNPGYRELEKVLDSMISFQVLLFQPLFHDFLKDLVLVL